MFDGVTYVMLGVDDCVTVVDRGEARGSSCGNLRTDSYVNFAGGFIT